MLRPRVFVGRYEEAQMTKIVLTDGVGTLETEGLVMTESWGVRWSDEDGRIHSLPWHRIWEVDADPVEPGSSLDG
jgi:hypothetical protein